MVSYNYIVLLGKFFCKLTISNFLYIVILIILATVTINMAFGENGLVKYAEEARDKTANSTTAEAEGINSMVDQFANVMAEDSEIPLPDPYVDSVLPTAPKLSDGMTPVKYEEGIGWVKTNEYDSSWYNYANKEWANIVLGDATFIESGDKEILDEEKAYSMLVWIPRYAYQITTNYHTNSTSGGNINIVFIDTQNKNKAGTTTYSEAYPNYATGSGMEDYVVHPAFNYGGTKLSGFWVGKYETSNTDCTTDKSTGEYDGIDKTVTIKANVTSWRSITISNMFTVGINLNNSENPYGLNTSDLVVDPHMMKNSEWGAVAYLSQNTTYGKESEVWINPNSNFITGQAGNDVEANGTTSTYTYNTSNGQQASTTGNIWGVYDMSGGTFERVAAYIENENENLNNYGANLVEANLKYKDLYSVGINDSREDNYEMLIPSAGKYGDAFYESSSSGVGCSAWYSDMSYYFYSTGPFICRGGCFESAYGAGIFATNENPGHLHDYVSFRLVLPVM